MSKKISKSLQKLIDSGAYRFLKCVRKDEKTGKCLRWSGITRACHLTGLSYETIKTLLKKYPRHPEERKYIEEFDPSAQAIKEGVPRHKGLEAYRAWVKRRVAQGKLTISTAKHQETYFLQAWKYLGNKKDMMNWEKEDYNKIWENAKEIKTISGKRTFFDEEARGFNIKIANAMHNLMTATNKPSVWKDEFSGVQRVQFKKFAHVFFNDGDIEKVVPEIKKNDLLLMFLQGIVKGARFASLADSEFQHYKKDAEGDIWSHDFERKIKKEVIRAIPETVYDLLKQYVQHYKISAKQKLFPRHYATYINELRNLCLNAGGDLKALAETEGFGLHMFKRTYINQAKAHGVSADTIVAQTGTQLRTLEQYYIKKDEAKIKAEMLGKKQKIIPFHIWINDVVKLFEKQFQKNLV